ncbi:MAG: ABC transporter permease [Promethearchaeota archaeon]
MKVQKNFKIELNRNDRKNGVEIKINNGEREDNATDTITTANLANITHKKQILKKLKSLSYSILSLIIFIAIWHFIRFIAFFSVIPSPISVFERFVFLWAEGLYGITLWQHVIASFIRVLLGFFYSFIIGVFLGLICGSNKILEKLVTPIIEILRPIPPIAWIPFSILLFGLTTFSYTFVIFIGAFFPIFQNTFDAIKSVKRVYKDVALSLGANKWQIMTSVVFPSIVPNIITGSRVSLGVAWMCVIAAEMIGISSNTGIGLFIIEMQNIGQMDSMLAGMLIIGIVGLLISGVFQLIEKSLLKWRE